MNDDGPIEIEAHAALALEIDLTMREKAPAGWKEDIDGPRGRQVLNALYHLMEKNKAATQRLFDIIKNQPGY
jgi:type I restriction enzyme R subunit